MVALYDYQAQGPEELTLHDGDIITLVAKEDDEWWKGQLNGFTGGHLLECYCYYVDDTIVGMFPAAYVEELQAN